MKKYIKSIRLIPMKVDCKNEEWYHVRFFLDDGSTVERAWWLRIPAGMSDDLYRYIFDMTHDRPFDEFIIKEACIGVEELCWYWSNGFKFKHLDDLHKAMEEE